MKHFSKIRLKSVRGDLTRKNGLVAKGASKDHELISQICRLAGDQDQSKVDEGLALFLSLIDSEPASSTESLVKIVSLTQNARLTRFVHMAGDFIPRKISEGGNFYEQKFLDFLSEFFIPGTTVLDVGANIGNHTIFFAQHLSAQVMSFEPEPHNFACLSVNIVLNSCESNVEIFNCALSDSRHEVRLRMNVADNYGSFTSMPPTDASKVEFVTAKTQTLDQFIADGMSISILKIDVEGMELAVLKGAFKTLSLHRPIVAVECSTAALFKDVEGFLGSFAYVPIVCMNSTPTFVFICRERQDHLEKHFAILHRQSVSDATRHTAFQS